MAKLTKKSERQISEYLGSRNREELVAELMDRVHSDAAYARSMAIRAAQATGVIDAAIYRRSIADALRSGSAARRDRPRTSGRWASDVLDAVEPVAQLIDDGHAAEAIDICEYALTRVEKLMERVDDSSGWFGEIVGQLEATHLRACRTCEPDPVKLAQRLFAWDAESDWDIFSGYVERYQDVLGADGLAEVQRLAVEFWDRLPEPTGGGFDRTAGAFRVGRTLSDLADIADDVDAKVEVMSRDLSHPYHYLQIAEVLAGVGRDGEALAWAERGLDVDHDIVHMRSDRRVDDFVLERYVSAGRDDEALTLLWRRHRESLTSDSYGRLKLWAGRVGRWDEQHQDAIDALRAAAAQASEVSVSDPTFRRLGLRPATHDAVVEAHVMDGDLDDAWEVARASGCSAMAWRKLADASRSSRPLDAAEVYEREVSGLIDRKTTRSYEDAVTRMEDICNLYVLAEREDLATDLVDAVRRKHAAKRKLIALVDDADLPASR